MITSRGKGQEGMGILHVPSTHCDLWTFLKEKGELTIELDGRHISGLVLRAKALQAEGRLRWSV